MWSINFWKDNLKYKLSLEDYSCLAVYVMSSGCTHESRGSEIKNNTKLKNILMKNNISLIIWSAIGWGDSLNS